MSNQTTTTTTKTVAASTTKTTSPTITIAINGTKMVVKVTNMSRGTIGKVISNLKMYRATVSTCSAIVYEESKETREMPLASGSFTAASPSEDSLDKISRMIRDELKTFESEAAAQNERRARAQAQRQLEYEQREKRRQIQARRQAEWERRQEEIAEQVANTPVPSGPRTLADAPMTIVQVDRIRGAPKIRKFQPQSQDDNQVQGQPEYPSLPRRETPVRPAIQPTTSSATSATKQQPEKNNKKLEAPVQMPVVVAKAAPIVPKAPKIDAWDEEGTDPICK